MAETTQKETQIKVRHWYGAARGMAIAFPLAFLLLALAVLVFAPLASANLPFTRELEGDVGLASAMSSVSILVSIVCMVTLLTFLA